MYRQQQKHHYFCKGNTPPRVPKKNKTFLSHVNFNISSGIISDVTAINF